MLAAGFVALLAWHAQAAPEGKVTLGLPEYEAMLDEVRAAAEPEDPVLDVSPIGRRIEGRFDKGLFSAELVARFRVHRADHLRVPVLDGAASLQEVRLDGRQTSLLSEGGMYTVGVSTTGEHEIRLRFFWGEEQDRFSRRLRFQLPAGGPTRLSVFLPEEGIEAKLGRGAIERTDKAPGGTRLIGHLDASGAVDLSWVRALRHDRARAARLENTTHTVITLEEAVVSGVTAVEVEVREGEADRVELALPEGIEILDVKGDAVLQWRTTSEAGENAAEKLVVLLRYLVADSTTFKVTFQWPRPEGDTVRLLLPLPVGEQLGTGTVGVEGAAGLKADVAEVTGAERLTLRDVPPPLVELSPAPLLLAFSFEDAPQISLKVERLGEVELTTTIIDDLQASTVMIEDGTEITKLKLRVRNNTRQYLTVELPPQAQLTHALLDGHPVRPAARPDAPTRLLFGLRQSERIGAGRERYHTVQPNETLSDIANQYYSDPTAWNRILDANEGDLSSASDLIVNQRIRIPSEAQVEESSFLIELAYKLTRPKLGWFGYREVLLPAVDVDVTRVTWHVYFPHALMPLTFAGNLTQYSAIRYDLFRRVRDYLGRAFEVQDAWAGGKVYKSILSQRRDLYRLETQKKSQAGVVLTSFPLVGDLYRFRRELAGTEQARLRIGYLPLDLQPFVQWGAFLAALLTAWWVLRAPREGRRWLIAGGVLFVLLIVAHHVLGVHRRVLWGLDAALLVTWGRVAWRDLRPRARRWLEEPWQIVESLSLRNFAAWALAAIGAAVVLWLPLLLSSALWVFLVFALLRRQREVTHA